jgi:malonyl-CoA O-methyltransferase
MSTPEERFSATVRHCFTSRAAHYEQEARLQAAIALRLARSCSPLAAALPAGPRADLGAGSGLLARALHSQLGGMPLLQLDACNSLLEQGQQREPTTPRLQWDLNQGLPDTLQGAALLASSFALQWLEQPADQLEQWCRALQPGGALALAVPCSGSFAVWAQASEQAGVPHTALELPEASALIAKAERWLKLEQRQQLRFSRANRGALALLREFKAIGAQASRHPRLSPGQLRRLSRHWPGAEAAIVWRVLVLVGRKR